MSHETFKAAALLCPPGQVAEVRVITEDGTGSGYFDNPGTLAAAVDTLDGLPGIQGIYITLNEVNPALLSRRANRVKTRLGKKDATTADTDILRRRWLPIDIDPVRPSGVSSTGPEHQAAIGTATRVAALLTAKGWPAPVIADSGNGAHLLYRIDCKNDDRSRHLVRQCLEVLAAMFDDATTTIDTANHNAARIWKLYGTLSRKGDHTPDRPHRRSRLLSVPGTLEVVPVKLLEQLAATLPDAPHGTRTGNRLDLGSWLKDHGIGITREKPYQGGTLYALEHCPFSSAHRDGAFAIQFPNGAIHAGCQHTSCGAGAQRWPELRETFEGEKKRPAQPSPAEHQQEPPGTPASPPPTPGGIPCQNEALGLLRHGDPKQFMLRTFALDYVGDEVPAECMILSLASRSVTNTNGLHVSVTGESGKGKSHAFTTLLRQIPARFRLAGRMSNKALFYIEDLQPGSANVFDDTTLSEDMAEILKGVTTSFREPFLYRTVSKDRKGQVCTIPERCIWWVAKVEGAGDDQVFNRMLTCWIDESAEQDDRVLARVLQRDQAPPDDQGQERPEVLTCQAIWENIGRQMFHVIIPFATSIRFVAHANRRNPEMLLDLIKANTVLRYMQREQTTCGQTRCLTATREDFREAARLYQLLNGIAGGQETKLTWRESALIGIISQNDQEEFTIPQLQKQTGWSNSCVHRLIHGYDSMGTMYSGLLEKCPAISFCDRTVVTDGEDGASSMRRRTNAYTFDRELYRSWSLGGSVWLDDDPDHPSASQQSFSNPQQTAARFESEFAGSDPENNTCNNDIILSSDQSPSKSQDTQNTVSAGGHGTQGPCEREIAEMLGDRIGKTREGPPFQDPRQDRARTYPLENRDPAEGLLQCCRKPGPPAPAKIHIRPQDYKPLEVPDHTFCRVCGHPWTHYVEKLTVERKNRPKDCWQPYQVCRNCYDRAKVRAQQSATILPGTVDPARMERLTTSLCRCTVCNLDLATYIDRGTGTKLCETCYQRITAIQDHGEVAG